ncbi:hypothetical protein ACFE04_023338 [Oxalis oulophora]
MSYDLWDIVDSTAKQNDNQEELKAWRKNNAKILLAIQSSCKKSIFSKLKNIDSAKDVWDDLAKLYGPSPKNALDDLDDMYIRFVPLKRAIREADLDYIKKFIMDNPNTKNSKLDAFGQTALHVAIDAGRIRIVKELLRVISDDDLLYKITMVIHLFVLLLYVETRRLLQPLLKRAETLRGCLELQTKEEIYPFAWPALSGTTIQLVIFIPSLLRIYLDRRMKNPMDLCFSLLVSPSISMKLTDIALDIIEKFPFLAIVENHYIITPLATLIRTPSMLASCCPLPPLDQLFYNCYNESRLDILQEGGSAEGSIKRQGLLDRYFSIWSVFLHVSRIKMLYDLKLNHICAMRILENMLPEIARLTLMGNLESSGLLDVFFEAVENGKVEIVVKMVKANPSFLYAKDKNERGIFMLAVQFRQENIFSLLYGIKTRKDLLINYRDKFENNMLHIAGMSPPFSLKDRIPNSALRMQRELQWYKEVESVINIMERTCYNQDNRNPREFFTKNHKNLADEAEKWIKDNASSFTFVCILIVAISFAATITYPGSNDQQTGYPLLLGNDSFKIFMVSNAVSLCFSSTSVLVFLKLLTTSYRERDFLEYLPKMMTIGFIAFLISIPAMTVAFCATFFTVLKGELSFLFAVLASFKMSTVTLVLFQNLKNTLISTIGVSVFDKHNKELAHIIM